MKKLLGLAFLLLSITAASPASAQSFGELFPVANTRYRTAFGLPHLTTNGSDFFLFWTSDRKIRATKLIEDGSRVGHVVLDVSAGFDVAWTGERFLAVTTRRSSSYPFENNIVGRFLDANTRPAGSERVIAHGSIPRVAAGPEAVLLLYRDTNSAIRALPLAADGANTGAASETIASSATGYAVAANANGFVAAIGESTGIRAVAFDAHGQTKGVRTLTHGDPYYRDVSVATDGTSYVAVWCEEQTVVAATIAPNGTFGAPLVIDSTTRLPHTPTVVWNGEGWTITYDGRRPSESRARVVHLDREAQRVVADEESDAGLGSPSVAALDGRIVAAWAPVNDPGGVSVIDLPLAANEPRPATFAATQQTLMATASSAEATLIVWVETGDGTTSLHCGLRTNDGRWTERELAVVPHYVQQVLAGSDGRNFVILYPENGKTELIRLDETGEIVRPRITLPISASVMAWNGTHYALIDAYGDTGRLLSPSGALSAPVTIPDVTFSAEALASDGNGFFFAGEVLECPFLLCYSVGVRGTRLGPDLRRIDPADIDFAEGSGEIAGAVWNGSEYVMIWSDADGNRVAHVPPTPLQAIRTHSVSVPLAADGVAAMGDGSIALVGPGSEPAGTTRVAILPADGNVAKMYDIEDALGINRSTLLAPLPNSGLAYVSSSVQDAAPHHGTSHVMMAIARPSLPLPPGPPHVIASLRDRVIVVDWSAPAGTVNGYRLEYRVDDGSWNELEDWFSAQEHHRTIRPSFGTNFEIRMRAFNDGGASAYSATALTKPIRRRAAGH